MAEHVLIPADRSNPVIACRSHEESLVLIAPAPVPRVPVAPRPYPRPDLKIETRFFAQFAARGVLKAFARLKASARRNPEAVAIDGVLGLQEKQCLSGAHK